MVASPKTFYLNADFDLSLRPRPRQRSHAILDRQVRELSAMALLGADEGDSALVRLPIPESFLAYLAQAGVPVPRLLTYPDTDPETRLAPFGWNAEAAVVNERHRRPAVHPPLEIVRRVNSRSYALQLEQSLFPGHPSGAMVASLVELESFLEGAEPSSLWMLKSEYGNAGLANRSLGSSTLTAADRKFVTARLAEDDRILIEPYVNRLQDWSLNFSVPFEVSALRQHECVYTRGGGMIGAIFDPNAVYACQGNESRVRTARQIATALEREGYFGSVCVDAFSYGDPERPRARSLVDLNCREAMSGGVVRLWRHLAPDKTVYYRSFAWSKLKLPRQFPETLSALGEDAYDPGTRTGILLGTPPSFEEDGPAPLRLTVLLFADDRSAVLALEQRFRDRFEIKR